ncbi:hypothetical protein BGZ94_010315 [Podila epigama]|nr:hypothetical protein BGZ94_010315 [Podila epigama]
MSLGDELAVSTVADTTTTTETEAAASFEPDTQLVLPPAKHTTETSLVVATFGKAAEQQGQNEEPVQPGQTQGQEQDSRNAKEQCAETALGLYEEPPKKKMRSTAAILLGAAVETVILTSAVALSAYNLLTGKGKEDPNMKPTDTTSTSAENENEKDASTTELKAQTPEMPTLVSASCDD